MSDFGNVLRTISASEAPITWNVVRSGFDTALSDGTITFSEVIGLRALAAAGVVEHNIALIDQLAASGNASRELMEARENLAESVRHYRLVIDGGADIADRAFQRRSSVYAQEDAATRRAMIHDLVVANQLALEGFLSAANALGVSNLVALELSRDLSYSVGIDTNNPISGYDWVPYHLREVQVIGRLMTAGAQLASVMDPSHESAYNSVPEVYSDVLNDSSFECDDDSCSFVQDFGYVTGGQHAVFRVLDGTALTRAIRILSETDSNE